MSSQCNVYFVYRKFFCEWTFILFVSKWVSDHDGDQNARMDLNENLGWDHFKCLEIGAI